MITPVRDRYGYESGRHQPMCDQFAEELYTKVYMPDLMGGDPIAKEGKGFWRQSLSIFKNTIDHPPNEVKRDIKKVRLARKLFLCSGKGFLIKLLLFRSYNLL